MKKKSTAVIIMTIMSAPVYAGVNTLSPDLSSQSITASASAGMLGGTSHEMVYDVDTGRKVSQLDWKIKNVAILKGGISWAPYTFMTLRARGWHSLASGSGHMDDYDWMNASQKGWTDHSSHPDTNVNDASEYDLSLNGWFFRDEHYKAGLVAGYQETRFSWTATGGSYNYDNGASTGNFTAGERVAGYSQRFSMPYIGLAGQYRMSDFELNAVFKFSDWVQAHDNDEHYMRELTFREKTTRSRYYGASVDAGYYVTPDARVFAELAYSKFEEGKGSTQVIDNVSGDSYSIEGDAAGISNKNYTITAGLQYRF